MKVKRYLLIILAILSLTFLINREAFSQVRWESCEDQAEYIGSAIPVTECRALESIYSQLNGPNWDVDDWFNAPFPCTWTGVICSLPDDDGISHVISINIWQEGASGTFPTAFGRLPYLERITITNGVLYGSIPPTISKLSNLTNLDLRWNRLSGSIPSEIGRLSRLESLALSENQLTGSMPEELGELSNLEILWLNDNQLAGQIPQEFGELASLRWSTLDGNKFTGNLPGSLGRLTNLERLDIAHNPMSGVLPLSLTNLEVLEEFRFSYTCLVEPDDSIYRNWTLSVQNYYPATGLSTREDCPQLTISSVDFEHRDIGSGQWEKIGSKGTVDGNLVRMTINVENHSDYDGSAEITIIHNDGSGEVLDKKTHPSFAPEGVTPVPFEIDTSGFSWKSDGSPQVDPVRFRITLDYEGENISEDDFEIELKIVPKPVILVHGLWSNLGTWNDYLDYLKQSHPDWIGYAVDLGTGENPFMKPFDENVGSIEENAKLLKNFIDRHRTYLNAEQVDVVAHSMGGLITRRYIHSMMTYTEDGRPILNRLVMLGTPNRGSTCALIPNKGVFELRPDTMIEFNNKYGGYPGVRPSILAGDLFEHTCYLKFWDKDYSGLMGRGDQWVSVASAVFDVTDNWLTTTPHTSMTSNKIDFLNFVKPRLAISRNQLNQSRYSQSSDNNPGGEEQLPEEEAQFIFAEQIQIPANSTATEKVEISSVDDFGFLFVGPEEVDTALIDPDGEVAWQVESGSNDSRQFFRSFYGEEPLLGTWEIQLKNTGATPLYVLAGVSVSGAAKHLDLTTELDEENDALYMQAMFTDDGAPGTNATIKAEIAAVDGYEQSVILVDDGVHDDGVPMNGIYGNQIENIPGDIYLFTAEAEIEDDLIIASTVVNVTWSQHLFLPIIMKQ